MQTLLSNSLRNASEISCRARQLQLSILQSNWTTCGPHRYFNHWYKTVKNFISVTDTGNHEYNNWRSESRFNAISYSDSFTKCSQSQSTGIVLRSTNNQPGVVLRSCFDRSCVDKNDVHAFIQIRSYCTNQPKTYLANEKTDNEKVKSSDTPAAKTTVTDLYRGGIWTVPNILTTIRMALAPLLGYLVLDESYSLACGVFMFAGLTDLLDGFIARTFPNQTSALGSFIDPLADKLLISILFVSLTIVNLLPVALTALVLVRDACLMTAGFYVRYISLNPRPKNLQEYFDITNPTAKLQPTFLSKVNTAIQLGVVAFTLAAPVFDYVDHPALQTLWYLTAATTLISGVQYIFAKDTFKLLQQKRTRS